MYISNVYIEHSECIQCTLTLYNKGRCIHWMYRLNIYVGHIYSVYLLTIHLMHSECKVATHKSLTLSEH